MQQHTSFRIIFSLFYSLHITAVYLPFQSQVQASQILISQIKSVSHINNLLSEHFQQHSCTSTYQTEHISSSGVSRVWSLSFGIVLSCCQGNFSEDNAYFCTVIWLHFFQLNTHWLSFFASLFTNLLLN